MNELKKMAFNSRSYPQNTKQSQCHGIFYNFVVLMFYYMLHPLALNAVRCEPDTKYLFNCFKITL